MASSQARLVERLQGLVADAATVRSKTRRGDWGAWIDDAGALAMWRSRCRGALAALGAAAATYADDFNSVELPQSTTDLDDFERQAGIVRAALADVESGYLLRSMRTLMFSEFLADLAEQASALLEGGYLAAASSVAGAELEQGLRAMCDANAIAVKAREDISSLAMKLGQAGHLSALQQKQIAAWKAVRDLADHGLHDQLKPADVEDLVPAVSRFLAEAL
jgi:hypothetical protein